MTPAERRAERIDQLEGQVRSLQENLKTVAISSGRSLSEIRGEAQNLKDREILEFLGD